MSELKSGWLRIPGVALGGESSLPAIAEVRSSPTSIAASLAEDDEVFLGYGQVDGAFPYRHQDLYTRSLAPRDFPSIILENRFLRATFVPDLGGRLWSLYDKAADRELTFSNPVFRLGNLAIRNAWFSGGVEWNFGLVGHHPFTCSRLFTARLAADDGTPVLRMYEFERIRACTYQVDFLLPDESPFLKCRMRIVNPTAQTVPVYWWSNIAVAERGKGRVIVSADAAYTSNGGTIAKTAVPRGPDGRDITYPVNSPYAWDYFWKVSPESRKYICHVDEDGYGLVQASTDRLRGRKLFVWGQGQGGANWQEYLSGNGNAGRYVEIQAGLAQTQFECLPMPPHTAWEWMEAYGAIRADPRKVHGEWQGARTHVERILEQVLPRADLESLLGSTRAAIALKPAQEILFLGSGWGALEVRRRESCGEPPLSRHLDFGVTGDEQAPWLALLVKGGLSAPAGEEAPVSYMAQAEWTALLAASISAGHADWHAWYQLALVHFVNRVIDRSREAFQKSLALKSTPWSLYGLSRLELLEGNTDTAVGLARASLHLAPGDVSLVKETLSLFLKTGRTAEILTVHAGLSEALRKVARVQLACAWAHLQQGEIEAAEEILLRDGGLIVPDIREGENSVTELWYAVQKAKAAQAAVLFDVGAVRPPKVFDFRMTS